MFPVQPSGTESCALPTMPLTAPFASVIIHRNFTVYRLKVYVFFPAIVHSSIASAFSHKIYVPNTQKV